MKAAETHSTLASLNRLLTQARQLSNVYFTDRDRNNNTQGGGLVNGNDCSTDRGGQFEGRAPRLLRSPWGPGDSLRGSQKGAPAGLAGLREARRSEQHARWTSPTEASKAPKQPFGRHPAVLKPHPRVCRAPVAVTRQGHRAGTTPPHYRRPQRPHKGGAGKVERKTPNSTLPGARFFP